MWDAIYSGFLPEDLFPASRGWCLSLPLFFEGEVCPGVCQALPCPLLAPSALLIKQAVHGAFTHVSGFGLFF